MEEELVVRRDRNWSERDFQLRRMAKLEEKRRKILDAYYAGAVDITMLKAEQEKIRRETRDVKERMAVVNAGLEKWKAIFGIATASQATAPTPTARVTSARVASTTGLTLPTQDFGGLEAALDTLIATTPGASARAK